MHYLLLALKLIVSLGILNVWIIRRKQATPYRGQNATTLREEFAVYGLPTAVYYAVGIIKVSLAVALLGSTLSQYSDLAAPAAKGLAALMLGAIAVHLKVSDPFKKWIPSIVVLALCVAILFLDVAPAQ